MLTIRSGRPYIGRIGNLIALLYPASSVIKVQITGLICVNPKLKHQKSRFLPVRTQQPTYHKWRIFGRATKSLKCHYMQQEVLLHELQTNQSNDIYAVVGGYRVSVDYAQAVVHFYKGEQEWGKLADTLPVEKWSGDWLIRIIGRFFRIEYQLTDDKAIASVQRNGFLSVRTLHHIGRAVLYQRILVDRNWDYCISFRNEVGFGLSVDKAIAELRSKLKVRATQEQAEVTLSVGRSSHITEQQLADFCSTNGLIPGGRYTRQQLRQTILRQRKVNCEQFRSQLQYFDVRINCK